MTRTRFFALGLSLLLAACAPESEDDPDLDLPLSTSGYALSAAGVGPAGPSASRVSGADTEVWAVTRGWEDVDSEAGMAWGSGSGLNWEEKYSAWVESMEETATHSGNRRTFIVSTPYGKELPIPYLECAELALALRAFFASWYGLPFYMQAKDASGKDIYLGHFGFIYKDGSRYRSTQNFRTRYEDYSSRGADALSNWPSDSNLRGRKLYGGGDTNDFLGDGATAGTYFDELLLNKRTGHFLMLLLPYFGSINLTDDANAHHVTAESLRASDILLKRWQKRGIGHVMITKSVVERPGGKLAAELASGSMPRRQAVWESQASSKMLYTNNQTGGEGDNWDGDAFVSLGGGLKRFNAPFIDNGTWRQRVIPAERDNYIPYSETARRSERPAIFQDLLVTVSPDELRAELLSIIEEKRAHLREHPSSCSAREAREHAFHDLYELSEEKFGQTRDEVDAEYRIVDDYIFAPLVYNQSRTCCWNSTNHDMYNVAISYEARRQEEAQACGEPFVFKMRDGAYVDYETHADELGVEWVAWSADEGCPQADTVQTDTETTPGWTPYCEIFADGAPVEPTEPDPNDPYEPNNSPAAAFKLEAGAFTGAQISDNDVDWFTFQPPTGATVRVTINFVDEDGDLDLKMYRGDEQVDSSTSWSSDRETVDSTFDGTEPLFIKVFGYDGATAPYTIDVSFEGGLDFGPPCDDDNESQETAFEVQAGSFFGLQICADDPEDWYRIPATVGAGEVRIDFSAAAGDLDMALYRSSGALVETAETDGDGETLDMPSGVLYLRVYGDANEYSLHVIDN